MPGLDWKKALVMLAVWISLMPLGWAETPQVEIFSWWIGSGEQEGLEALFQVFTRNYPEIRIVNAAVAGGGGINAKAVLQTRMVGTNPPDSFQVHGGAELIASYVKTGMMEPITALLDAWGIRNRFNSQILEMCSYKGEIYSIPLNVHRGNVLWYNQALLNRYGLTAPDSFEALLDACRRLQGTGLIPLALGDRNKWEATHLFETLLAMTLGPAKYNGLWKGMVPFTDSGVRRALEHFGDLLPYVNSDHAALTWQDAVKMVYDGKAVFNVMGDWAEGYFKTLGWAPGRELGWRVLSGPGGNFMVITDSFGLPKNAPNRRGAEAWLKTVASVAGQDTFNPIKGAIPSRFDANLALYDPYLRSSMKDFARLTLTPSIAHGSAASLGFSAALDDLLVRFISDGDLERAWKSLQAAAGDYLE